MNINDLYNHMVKHIKTYIKIIPSVEEIIVRCPYCGDSKKHTNKGHFYIGTKYNLFFYQCKRAECSAVGLLNRNTLEALGIIDIELFAKLTKHNNEHRNNSVITIYTKPNDRFSTYNFDKFKYLFKNKMDYLTNRLYNEDEIDLNKYRVIFSPINFIETFNLELENLNPRLLQKLEHEAIGFLNGNGSCISFRYIHNNYGYRYFKLKLSDDMDIYTINSHIDLYKAENIEVDICEGIFDCINIKNRLYKDNPNRISVAVNGCDYINKIGYIAKVSGLINMHINIFKDSDMPNNIIHNQLKRSIFKDNYSIYRNSLSKDYSEDGLYIIKEY